MASKKHKELKANVLALLKAMDNSYTSLWKPKLDESIGCYVEFPEAITYEPEGPEDDCHDDDHNVQGFSVELEILNTQLRGELVEIYLDGDWSTPTGEQQSVIIWDKGEVVNIRANEITTYLDERGYDCYIIPTEFEHEDWNGSFIYKDSPFDKKVRELEFTETVHYFDYVISSSVNGQPQQVRNLYATLKEYGEDREFKDYVKDTYDQGTLLEILEIVS